MASAPSPSSSSSACAPRPAAAAAAAAAAAEAQEVPLCEDCGDDPRPAVVFCTFCKSMYCVECDAATHVRARKNHERVPVTERPALCSIHNKDAEAFCEQEERPVCASCLMVEVGACAKHPKSIKQFPEAAAHMREKLAQLSSSFNKDEEGMVQEVASLTALRVAIDERIVCLEEALAHARAAQANLTNTHKQSDIKVLTEIKSAREQASTICEQMLAALGDRLAWQAKWKQLSGAVSTCAGKQVIAAAAATASPHALQFKVPNLDALSPPRTIPSALKRPAEIKQALAGDLTAVIVADRSADAPSYQVWLDNSQPPRQLPPATAHATCVLLLEENGYLVVSSEENRVERIGNVAWKRNLQGAFGAVVDGDAVLVTEYSESQVTRLDMRTGNTINSFGQGVLRKPVSIVMGSLGEIYVSDEGTNAVYAFDVHGALLHTFGQGLLRNPVGVSVDGIGRVYVADYAAQAIVVFDGASGTHLKSIAVGGRCYGLLVTRLGQIVVNFNTANSLIMFE